jgi:FkbM family methyltransferase
MSLAAGRRLGALASVTVVLAAFAVYCSSYAGHLRVARTCARLERDWNHHPLERAWLQHSRLRLLRLFEPLAFAPARVEIEPGVSLLLDPYDLISKAILLDSEWEPAVWRSISDGLHEGSVLLDVGAHIGYDSLKGAVKVGKTGQVLAFEPNPDTLKLLRDNIAASHAANVIVEPIACTDREQTLTLYGAPRANTGSASLARENAEFFGDHATREFRVRGRPIDDVVREAGLKRVDVIKIDVEGAEYYVLRGALETLKRFHPKLIVEIVPRQLAAMHTKAEDIYSLLAEADTTATGNSTRAIGNGRSGRQSPSEAGLVIPSAARNLL